MWPFFKGKPQSVIQLKRVLAHTWIQIYLDFVHCSIQTLSILVLGVPSVSSMMPQLRNSLEVTWSRSSLVCCYTQGYSWEGELSKRSHAVMCLNFERPGGLVGRLPIIHVHPPVDPERSARTRVVLCPPRPPCFTEGKSCFVSSLSN